MLGRFIIFFVLLGFLSCDKQNFSNPPNIILFFVDDLGWQDTSVPFWNQETKFNKRYKTPNMERLSAKGIKFTNAYSTPVCSPTRVSLMTGMNAARHRVTNWTLRPDQIQPMEKNHPVLEFPFWNFNGMTTSEAVSNAALATPLPELLKNAGYFTIHAGKAHLGAIGYPAENPLNLGFDINIAGHAAGAPGSYLGTDNFGNNDPLKKVWAIPGLEKYHGENIFLTQALTQEAMEAMEKPLSEDQSFFLYFAPYGVHTPLMADERFIEPYLKKGISLTEAKYASMIDSMDYALGNLMDYIEAKGVENETVILFMSDNGGLSAVARAGEKHIHNAPLNSGKGAIYEGGIRVPMLAYWPKVTPANSIETTPLIIEDFFPSILEIAQVEHPETIQTVDGQSFVPLLKSESQDRGALFWHYPNAWGPSGPGIGSYSAIREGNWKLIYFHEKQKLELYNLETDIGEKQDLVNQNQEKASQLAKKLTEHLISVKAQMPKYKATQQFVPWPAEIL